MCLGLFFGRRNITMRQINRKFSISQFDGATKKTRQKVCLVDALDSMFEKKMVSKDNLKSKYFLSNQTNVKNKRFVWLMPWILY